MKPEMSASRPLTLAALSFLVLFAACGDDDDGITEPTNRNPVASISAAPLEVPENDGNQTVVTLDGSGSSDPDNDPLTFSWDVPSGTFVNGTSAASEVAEVTFPGTAPYVVTLTVTDGQGGSDDASVTIGIIVPANEPPSADIVADKTTAGAGEVVTLDGSGSTDPEGGELTFSWNIGASGTFQNGTTATDEVIQVSFPGTGTYTVTLTVTDPQGAEATAQIAISPS